MEDVVLSIGNYPSEGLFRKFLRSGTLMGLPLGGWYAVGSTIQRYALSTNTFLGLDFLTRFVVAAVVGLILAGAWEVLLDITLQRYEYDSNAREKPVTPFRMILVEGGLRYGPPLGFFLAVATTFGQPGISWDPVLWLSFFFSLGFYLALAFLVGCGFGSLIFGASKMFRPGQG